VIPRLVASEELDESYAALDQPAGDQAARAKVTRGIVVDAVEFQCRFRLAADVECFTSRVLHLGRKFVTGDSRFEVVIAWMLLEVFTVEAI
jgi:hypothetical protein